MSIDPECFCRDLESYLCRKNDGHLVRIVGPAFDLVRGWAMQGIPYKVACSGIDRSFERYYAKGPRRRPVRIEFCEADVLEAFDDWRRAVGVHAAAAATGGDVESAPRRQASLPAHLERIVVRLTGLRAGGQRSAAFTDTCDRIVAEIDAARAGAKAARGDARRVLLERLVVLDGVLLGAARSELTASDAAQLHTDAEAELAPFRGRMEPAAYEAALAAAADRLVRERLGLPDLKVH